MTEQGLWPSWRELEEARHNRSERMCDEIKRQQTIISELTAACELMFDRITAIEDGAQIFAQTHGSRPLMILTQPEREQVNAAIAKARIGE